jgi:hypothetical protein
MRQEKPNQGRDPSTAVYAPPIGEAKSSLRMTDAHRRERLSAFQFDISDVDVGAQLVFAVSVILERLAQPAPSFAVAFAIDVADAGARVDQATAGVLRGKSHFGEASARVVWISF